MQPKLVQSPLVNGILVKLGHCVACACKTHLTSPRIKFDRLCSVESKADLAPWGTNQICRTPGEEKPMGIVHGKVSQFLYSHHGPIGREGDNTCRPSWTTPGRRIMSDRENG